MKPDSLKCTITKIEYNYKQGYHQYNIEYIDKQGIIRTNEISMVADYKFY